MRKLLSLVATLMLSIVATAQTPTVVGRVTCSGKPVADVVVSDGELVTRTDADGRYALASTKPCGYVFISIPSGYEVDADGLIPHHFGYTTKAALDEIDFELRRVKNDNFTLFISTDSHLRGDPEELDLPQFRQWYRDDIRREIERTKGPVYSLHLGDMTTDVMWHRNRFGLREYLDVMKTYPTPIFHIPGNHDNERFIDFDIPDPQWDSIAQEPYRRIIGPNYYSFNLGKVHFVMLDNIIVRYGRRPNGTHKTVNNYWLDERQHRWLERDLATVDSSTPLVVCMHVPVFSYTGIDNEGNGIINTEVDLHGAALPCNELAAQLLPLIERFEFVHILSGHTHKNANVLVNNRIFQQTFVSTSAISWKISGPEKRLVSEDGSPGGYGILRVRGKKFDRQFKANGYTIEENQFRVYDLNHVPEKFGGKPASNRLLINVYNWDDRWQIEVREGKKQLPVERTWTRDPLYRLIRHDVLPTRPTAFRAVYNAHMFEVETSAEDTPIEVIVTDHAGRRYRQQVVRPKRFDWQIE